MPTQLENAFAAADALEDRTERAFQAAERAVTPIGAQPFAPLAYWQDKHVDRAEKVESLHAQTGLDRRRILGMYETAEQEWNELDPSNVNARIQRAADVLGKRSLGQVAQDATIVDVLSILPFSPLYDYEKKGYREAKRRLETGDYSPNTMYGPTLTGFGVVRPGQTGHELRQIVKDYELEQARGQTLPAAIVEGVAQLPAYITEFSVGAHALKASPGVTRLAQKVGIALGNAGVLTALQPHRVTSALADQALRGETGPRAVLNAFGDVYIENISEMTGEAFPVAGRAILEKLPFGGQVLAAMKKYANKIGMADDVFWRRISKRAGYNGLLNEWGEERVGTILRGVVGVNDFGAGPGSTFYERVAAGLKQDLEVHNQLVEGAVLLTPAGVKMLGKSLSKLPMYDTNVQEALDDLAEKIQQDQPAVQGEGAAAGVAQETKPSQPPSPATTETQETGATGAVELGDVQRYQERGSEEPSPDKPHGLYLTPTDVESPHTDYGSVRYTYKWHPQNPLDVSEELWVTTPHRQGVTRRSAIPASSGIKALKQLVSEEEFTRLLSTPKQDLMDELLEKYPKVEWDKYFDGYEMLEGYAGVLAREQGYDAFVDTTGEEFSERVALSESAVTLVSRTDLEQEAQDAEETGTEAGAPGAQEGVQGPTQGSLRLRDTGQPGAAAQEVERLGTIGGVAGPKIQKTMAGEGKTVSGRQIVQHLEKALGVPIKGMVTSKKKAAGFYEPKARGIRQIDVAALDTASHEVGHHIHRQTMQQSGWPKGAHAEMMAMGRSLYGDKKPVGGYASEGVAEFVRGYLTGNRDLAKEAPKFYKWFNKTYLPKNPDIAEALNSSRELITQFREAGAVGRMRAQINRKDIRRPFKEWIRDMGLWGQTAFANEFTPLRTAIEQTGLELDPVEHPFTLATYFTQKAGARTRSMVLDKTVDLWGNVTGKGLRDVLSPIDNTAIDDFFLWMTAARGLNLWKRGINPGFTQEDAQYVYDLFKDNEGWQEVADEVTDWSGRVLQYVAQAGGLSQDEIRVFREANPVYIPFTRYFNQGEIQRTAGTGRSPAGTPKAAHRIKGSGRQQIEPLEAMIRQTHRMVSIAHKTFVARALANIANREENVAGFIWRIPAPTRAVNFDAKQVKKQLEEAGVDFSDADISDAILTIYSNSPVFLGKENVISFVLDGKRTFYEVEPNVYKMLVGMDSHALPRWLNYSVGKATRAVRLGATGLNASFGLLRNPLRDMQDTVVKAKFARGPVALAQGLGRELSLTGWAKAMGIQPDEAARAYIAQGGKMSQYLGQDRTTTQHLRGEALASTSKGKALVTVEHPVDAMREVFGLAETALRVEEYKRGLEHYGKMYGEGSPNAIIAAFNAAQDQTINYSRHGTIGRYLNQMIPFWNSNVQDISKHIRNFRERGAEAIALGIGFLTIPALSLWWLNKDEEWYKELPEYEKGNYIHIQVPGKDTIVRLPVPFLTGHLFMGLPVAAMDAMYRSDPGPVLDMWGEMFTQDIKPLVDTPAVVSPLIDALYRNKDWADRPIVPEGLQGKLPSDQYKDYTTEFSKSVAQALNQYVFREKETGEGISPLAIEYMLNGYSGGLYRRGTSAVGKLTKATGDQAADLPVIGTLFVRDPYAPRQTIEAFYRRSDVLDKKKQSDIITDEENADRLAYGRARRQLTPYWKELSQARTVKERKRLYADIKSIIDSVKQ